MMIQRRLTHHYRNQTTPTKHMKNPVQSLSLIGATMLLSFATLAGASDRPSRITSQQLQACPTGNSLTSPNFYRCMVGVLNGEEPFTRAQCDLKISESGDVVLTLGAEEVRAAGPFTAVMYTKQSYGEPKHWAIIIGALANGATAVSINGNSPEWSKKAGGAAYPGLQVSIGQKSCSFPL